MAIQRMVIFGASGDLTSRLLMPAIAHLAAEGLLPPGLTIVGAADTDWPTQRFRQHIRTALRRHAAEASSAHESVLAMLR